MEEIIINPMECKRRQGHERIAYFSISLATTKVSLNNCAIEKLKLEKGICLLFRQIGKVFYINFTKGGQEFILNKDRFEFSNTGFVEKVMEIYKPYLPADKICTGLKWQIGLECDKDGWYELIGEPLKLYKDESKNTSSK
ncbi:hypothetical protein VB796_21130 [Arcicella sp. LKC2W]|uniref:hypothetical protein n=1 Tax=Arcicella sp. LKC2W TaxID=2984198 RepID=UPI002B206444|nr:hypothetical protein [Arcicella sp. LKC2W]MEA5461584.1 hypothetical protein [Arcicella sp. LKC2W]